MESILVMSTFASHSSSLPAKDTVIQLTECIWYTKPELRVSTKIRSPAVQKLSGFSAWKPTVTGHGLPGLPVRKPTQFLCGRDFLFYFTTFTKRK